MTAKLVLEIVSVLLTNTVDVKLLTLTVPVMAGKLAMFTVLVKLVTVTLVGKLLTATVPVIAGKLFIDTVPVIAGREAIFTVDVKLLTTTCPLVPMLTVQVPS